MKPLMIGLLLLGLGGCMNGALYGTEEYRGKQLIVQMLQQDHATFTQKDVDWIYRRAMAYPATPIYDPVFSPEPYYNGAAGAPFAYVPGIGMMPRGRSNCMQYGTLGQGGQFSCW